jgi:hypothetical protein
MHEVVHNLNKNAANADYIANNEILKDILTRTPSKSTVRFDIDGAVKLVYASNISTEAEKIANTITTTFDGVTVNSTAIADNTYNAGDIFVLPEANVTLTAIWEEAPEIPNEITSVVIDGMTLTVSGSINSKVAQLCVGTGPDDSEKKNFFQDITIGENGRFTVSFDLNTLEIDGAWYNVHLLGLDSDNNVINVMASLDKLVDGDGNAIAKDTELDMGYSKIKVVSWDGDNGFKSLSFEVDYKEILVGGKPTATNNPFGLVVEDGKVYLTFNGEFNGNDTDRSFELLLTYEDPKDYPTLDATKIVATGSNLSANGNAFSFKVDLSGIANGGGWIRFVLKVTEGDAVTYYTIKPWVESHNGDWNALTDAIVINGSKYELAICWSSVFVQVVNP